MISTTALREEKTPCEMGGRSKSVGKANSLALQIKQRPFVFFVRIFFSKNFLREEKNKQANEVPME